MGFTIYKGQRTWRFGWWIVLWKVFTKARDCATLLSTVIVCAGGAIETTHEGCS